MLPFSVVSNLKITMFKLLLTWKTKIGKWLAQICKDWTSNPLELLILERNVTENLLEPCKNSELLKNFYIQTFLHFCSTISVINISVQKRIWFMFGIYRNFSEIVFFSLAKCIQCNNAQFIKSSESYFQ